jgi:hypothetical protein
MNKQPNTLAVRNKYLKINIGIDAVTNVKVTEMVEKLVSEGYKKPSVSLMIRHALRELSKNFSDQPLDTHFKRLKSLA